MSKETAKRLLKQAVEQRDELETTADLMLDHSQSWDRMWEIETLIGVSYAANPDARPTRLAERLGVIVEHLKHR